MNLEKLEFEKLIEQISTLYREKKYSQLKSILADINPTDIAVLFDEFPNEQRILLFRSIYQLRSWSRFRFWYGNREAAQEAIRNRYL